jgi:hypothetical protein
VVEMTKQKLLQDIEEAEAELKEAESKLSYLQSQLEDGDYEDDET